MQPRDDLPGFSIKDFLRVVDLSLFAHVKCDGDIAWNVAHHCLLAVRQRDHANFCQSQIVPSAKNAAAMPVVSEGFAQSDVFPRRGRVADFPCILDHILAVSARIFPPRIQQGKRAFNQLRSVTHSSPPRLPALPPRSFRLPSPWRAGRRAQRPRRPFA